MTPTLFAPLVPLTTWLLGSLIFAISIQLPPRLRVLLFPYILFSTTISLFTSPNLARFPALPEFWAFHQLIWTHHALAILLLEPVPVPHGEGKWLYIRKIWPDTRRFTDWKGVQERLENPQPGRFMKRMVFVGTRVVKTVVYAVAYRFIAQTLAPGLMAFTQVSSQDFAPEKRTLLRRVLLRGEMLAGKEFVLRSFLAVEWIVLFFFALDAYNAIVSIWFVAVLRFDEPEEWTPLFGSPLEAYSIRKFWGKFWHSILTPAALTSGRAVWRRVLSLPRNSALEKMFLAFWVFFVSAVNHGVAEYITGRNGSSYMGDHMKFFIANFVAVTGEVYGAKLVGTGKGNGRNKRLLGYAWVFSWFFWVVPKWKYGVIYDTLKSVEEGG